jgi:hypothetical protein
MRNAALTLMALSLLLACSDTIERGAPVSSAMPQATYIVPPKPAGIANVSVPFFTTSPVCCNGPQPGYGDGGYGGGGMMISLGGGFARSGGFSYHR